MFLPVERPRLARGWLKQSRVLLGSWPWRLLAVLGSLALLASLTLIGYQASARPATLRVDGNEFTLRTHQRLVGGVLGEAGLSLGPGDQVYPALDTPWQPGQVIAVQRALPVTVRADGREIHFYGRPHSLLQVLTHSDVSLGPGDIVYVNGKLVPESDYADSRALQRLLSQQMATGRLAAPLPSLLPLQVEIQRAIPMFVYDDGPLPLEIRVTATTVGAALEQAGFHIYQADRVNPALDTPASTDLPVHIERATPVRISADGRSYTTRTWSTTVAELLQEEDLELGRLDRVTPSLPSPLQKDMHVQLTRITTLDLVDQTIIPYQNRQESDPSMEMDHYYLHPGEEGLKEMVTRVTYADGQELGREFLGEQVIKKPQDQVFYYGTNIVIRTLETPHGTFQYWRKLYVLATHYYPSTCDKEPGHPLYGITYTGRWATRGIIAVDPRVIPLHTKMYVPGYGPGAAEDIGGAIKGLHIDVCLDDADEGKGLWDTRYLEIYLLTPVPPIGSFPWIINR